MSIKISLESSMEAPDVGQILTLADRLEPGGVDKDSRVCLSDVSILYGSLGSEEHISLLGKFAFGCIAITVTHPDFESALDLFRTAVCKNFKVSDSPF